MYKLNLNMKKSYIIFGGIALLAIILFFSYRGTYNKAIEFRNKVDNEAWGNVQTMYQRRADLVPQLVETVKGAAANEKDILTKVTNARAGIAGINDEILNAKNPEQMEIAGKKINTAINLAFEAYPQIQSTKNFQDLQGQLEGSENRIAKARTDYNEAVKNYNTHIEGFFNSMFLNKQTFPVKESFKASAGSEIAPEVNF
jgi:LemA protein